MRWKGRRQSTNIEDRRGGSSGGFSRSRGGAKVGGFGFVILLLIYLFTGQGQNFLDNMGGDLGATNTGTQTAPTGTTDQAKEFIGVVLKDTEDVWNPLFQSAGLRYQEPKLVLFQGGVRSACGYTSSAAGPFYCPGDLQIYIDPGFFSQLSRMGVKGDFAQAYVIAHEVGHHVQKLQGISDRVRQMQRSVSKTQANQLSVLIELQADCYAGIWARRQANHQLLDDGDLQEAINAAASIGDDTIQQRSGGHVNPASFTHGTSSQRMEWLKKGMVSGDVNSCNTFAGLS